MVGLFASMRVFPVMKLTRVEITLRRPTTIDVPDGPLEGVVALRCYADDPAAFVAAARRRVSDGSSGQDASRCPPRASSSASS